MRHRHARERTPCHAVLLVSLAHPRLSAQASSPSCFPTSLFQLLPTSEVRSSLGNSFSAPVEGCRGHKPCITERPSPRELVGFLLSDTNTDVTDWMLLFALAAGKLKVRFGTQPEQLSCPPPGV